MQSELIPPNGTDIPAAQPTDPCRVLLVDDFEPWRRLVSSMLEPNKQQLWIVGEAADGLEAVQKARELKPDLVLVDIGLPSLSGLEVATRIRGGLPEAKILFVTQNNDEDITQSALRDGAQGYILKARARSELLHAIETVLRGEEFVSNQY